MSHFDCATVNRAARLCNPRIKRLARNLAQFGRVRPVAGVFSCLVFVLVASLSARSTGTGSSPTVVAIGDVHGDFDSFCLILEHVGLIDERHHWTGDGVTLVQTGDLLDRGPKARETIDLVAGLEGEASKSGGRVVALLGNHEMMNLMGDLRYVTQENYASFADAKSEDTRKQAYEEYVDWRSAHQSLLAGVHQPVFEATESGWMAKHPLGFIEQRRAFGPKGAYGKWIRERHAVAEIDGLLFAHGGIAPGLTSLSLENINGQIRNEMDAFDQAKQYLESEHLILPFFTLQELVAVVQAEIASVDKSSAASTELDWSRLKPFLEMDKWLSVREDGPLWYRGYDQWTDEEGEPLAQEVLEAYGAKHIVIAHTVQRSGRIRSRFMGKVFLIDTGMLSSYWPGGRASALEVRTDGSITAKYMDGREVLLGGMNPQGVQRSQPSLSPPHQPNM